MFLLKGIGAMEETRSVLHQSEKTDLNTDALLSCS